MHTLHIISLSLHALYIGLLDTRKTTLHKFPAIQIKTNFKKKFHKVLRNRFHFPALIFNLLFLNAIDRSMVSIHFNLIIMVNNKGKDKGK